MTHKIKFCIALCILLLATGIISSLYVLKQTGNDNDTVEIVQDGKILQTINLSQIKNRQVFSVSYQGRTNTIEADKNKIRIIEAHCPDKTCIKKGYLTKDGLPIVCLPNHLIIRYSEHDTLDSMTD